MFQLEMLPKQQQLCHLPQSGGFANHLRLLQLTALPKQQLRHLPPPAADHLALLPERQQLCHLPPNDAMVETTHSSYSEQKTVLWQIQ
jgi:hypothetical protein